jgi:hypothetical protein
MFPAMSCPCNSRNAMSSVVYVAIPYVSVLSEKRHGFRKKKKVCNEKCVFGVSLQFCPKYFYF